jgi:excisionase family DNA binding protein
MTSTRLTLDDLADRATCTISEAGELLGVSRVTAYAAAHAGRIPTIRVGERRLVVPLARLRAMLGADGEEPGRTCGHRDETTP